MVLLGGLEIVVGGYLVHRYHKNKNEKKRLHDEAQQRRHNTFPGAAKPNPYYEPCYQQQQAVIPPQKHACYAPLPQPTPQYPVQHQAQYHCQPRPRPSPHARTFTIPRRPLPQQQYQPQIIQPLQRSDSFATISRMPIANGSRPQDIDDDTPSLPPRRQGTNLSPIPHSPVNSPYGNAAFSVSTPAFGATPTSPPITYTASPQMGRNTVDDNWETYGIPHGHYAPSESTQLGEDDPPPPYRP